MKTDTMQIHDLEEYARQLYAEIGPRSVAVAARRAAEAAAGGLDDHAQKWRRIEEHLIGMHGQFRS